MEYKDKEWIYEAIQKVELEILEAMAASAHDLYEGVHQGRTIRFLPYEPLPDALEKESESDA